MLPSWGYFQFFLKFFNFSLFHRVEKKLDVAKKHALGGSTDAGVFSVAISSVDNSKTCDVATTDNWSWLERFRAFALCVAWSRRPPPHRSRPGAPRGSRERLGKRNSEGYTNAKTSGRQGKIRKDVHKETRSWVHRGESRGEALQRVQVGCGGQTPAEQGGVVGGGRMAQHKRGGRRRHYQGAERTGRVWVVEEGPRMRRRTERRRQWEELPFQSFREYVRRCNGRGVAVPVLSSICLEMYSSSFEQLFENR